MLEARELDLELAFACPGALREYFENQLGAIEHAQVERALDVALLRRRELMVEDDERRVQLGCRAAHFVDLAATGVELGIGALPAAAQHAMARDAGALDQAHDFLDALLVVGVAEVQAHDDR